MRFFKRLNYSFGNEDWRTEEKALQIGPEDSVVCITASGDRPLNLLLNECRSMVAVDMNPHQNHLLKLKVAAMQKLDFKDYLGFLGGHENHHRKKIFYSLLPLLERESGDYWKKHLKKVQKGVLYQGSLEKWTKVISAAIKVLRRGKPQRLFAFDDIGQQKTFVEQEWASPRWKKAFELALNPFVTRFLLKDPGLHEYIDESLNIGRYIHDRMNKSLGRGLARENLLISLFLTGKVAPEGYPPYLRECEASTIRQRLTKLSVVDANIIEYLETIPHSSIDAFSLSDVASYLNPQDFQRLTQAIAKTAKPGARFCIRQFLSNHKIPDSLHLTFKRNHSLEQELEEEDRCFVYRFMTGVIDK